MDSFLASRVKKSLETKWYKLGCKVTFSFQLDAVDTVVAVSHL